MLLFSAGWVPWEGKGSAVSMKRVASHEEVKATLQALAEAFDTLWPQGGSATIPAAVLLSRVCSTQGNLEKMSYTMPYHSACLQVGKDLRLSWHRAP